MPLLVEFPMLAIFGGLISGIALAIKFGQWHLILSAPVICAWLLIFTYTRDRKGQLKIFAAIIFISFVCALRIYFTFAYDEPKSNITFKRSEGLVTFTRTWGKMHIAVIKTHAGNFLIRTPFLNYPEGTRITFDGVTRPLKKSNIKSRGFNEFLYWRGHDVDGWLSIYNIKVLEPEFNLHRLRFLISRWLSIHTNELTCAYLKAALLGERDEKLSELHRNTGTSHLLAVSGFHVGILILCASLFFKNNIILSVILWLYIILTGASPSALRAGLMLQVYLISKFLGRPSNGLNNVSFAGVLLLTIWPYLYFDIGYRLSVIAALTIAAMHRSRVNKKFLWLLISPVVFAATFPQVAYIFGDLPAVGIFLNLFAPVYFSFVFSLASIGIIMLFLKIPFSGLFLTPAENLFAFWNNISKYFSVYITDKIPYSELLASVGIWAFVYVICKRIRFTKRQEFFTVLVIFLMSVYLFVKP